MDDYYVQEYLRHGLRWPCNWYRTGDLNANDELSFARDHPGFKFNVPAMIVMAENDKYLPPSLADGMEDYFAARLKKGFIPSYHWTLLENP